MAKKSKTAKNDQRRLVVAGYAARRAALKAIIAFPGSAAAPAGTAGAEAATGGRR
ncbi:hypothetical protein [Streptomyces naganishii]|uniref:Uncharacterized protein n=1 Tax=Streptomyces naganishii JCM 4654 TaxID=1306179 RepID=A0A919CWI5_9ACTN|nr:hypothetical protein GCM10010508_37670 [Streptomyces naganishii JCM 4654]